MLGWGLVLGVVAIAGLPPLGIFMSEFLVVSSTFAREPLLAIVLVFGIAGRRSARCSCGSTASPSASRAAPTARGQGLLRADVRASRRWCSSPASICRRRWSPGSRTSRSCWDRRRWQRCSTRSHGGAGRRRTGPGRASWSTEDGWRARDEPAWRPATGRCSACGARPARCTWRCSTSAPAEIARRHARLPGRRFPSVGALHPPAIRLERAIRDLFGLEPVGVAGHAALARSSAAGACGIRSARGADAAGDAAPYRVPAGRRREPAPDPGRPGACRHHRARPFPLHRQRRDRGAARGAARLCPQGHRGADGGRRRSTRRRGSPAASPATAPSPMRSPSPAPSRRRSDVEAPPRARLAARADGRARAARQPFRRHRRDLQRRLLLASCMPIAASCASACCAPPTPASATG